MFKRLKSWAEMVKKGKWQAVNKNFIWFLAAVAFKNAKQFDQAREACLREAEAHENNKAYLFIDCYSFFPGSWLVAT